MTTRPISHARPGIAARTVGALVAEWDTGTNATGLRLQLWAAQAELAELVGLDAEPTRWRRSRPGPTSTASPLWRIGTAPRKGAPDRRAWLLERLDAEPEPVSAGSPMTAVTPPTAPARVPGFAATLAPAIDATATVLGRLELPSW